MKLYSNDENYKLYHGSMLDMVEIIEPESIDAIITDPPYELNFMNKGWDNSGIAFQKDTWKKCYDVLKPGGHLLAFGGSRTFHRIACAIEDAGFEIRDTIMWIYGSGFPKSMDISKQIDKRGGNNTSFLCNLIKEKREEKNLSQKQLDKLMGTNGMVNWWEKGERGITTIQFNKLCEILELPFKNIEEAEREVIGKKEYTNDKNIMNVSNYNGERVHLDITVPSTDLAKQWNGWGTALKPSFEPIIVARKPFKGSLVDNIIENGVGGINIDECRVPISKDDIDIINAKSSKNPTDNYNRNESKKYGDYALNIATTANEQCRFPANTILTYDDSDYDEVCGGFPNKDTPNGSITNPNLKNSLGNGGIYGHYSENQPLWESYNDSGSASRYFYCAKASKRDRDEGLPNKWLDSLEIILQNGNEELLWKDMITIKEVDKVKHLMDMDTSLQKVIEESGILMKKDTDLNMLLFGKNILEKYLKENKYITKIGINSTTKFQILNLLTLYNTKENILNANYEMVYGGNPVNIVVNTNQLQIIIKEKAELAHGVNNVVLKMLWKINEKDGRNEHCTVKPISLMQYLVRLITPKGGTVLDPFNGSGSTGKACMYENADRKADYKYIGIELTEEYLPIAKARIEFAEKNPIMDYMESVKTEEPKSKNMLF